MEDKLFSDLVQSLKEAKVIRHGRLDYDKSTDTLTMRLVDQRVMESDEAHPGVILNYDNDGNIVGIEILQASKASAVSKAGKLFGKNL
jgi:uncharacterized protein YuzE